MDAHYGVNCQSAAGAIEKWCSQWLQDRTVPALCSSVNQGPQNQQRVRIHGTHDRQELNDINTPLAPLIFATKDWDLRSRLANSYWLRPAFFRVPIMIAQKAECSVERRVFDIPRPRAHYHTAK
jgi:hypothetical protein